MAAELLQIADALTAVLNNGSWSQSFTAARRLRPLYDLPDFESLTVTVVPAGRARTLAARALTQTDYTVHVAVQKQVTPETNADADPLLLLIEEFDDALLGQRLTGYTAASCIASANKPAYHPGHLDELNLLTTVLELTYRVIA
jgi:hypothetical protein